MDTTQHIAVIGSGYWGKNLVRNYHQLGVLKLICDKNETVLSSFQDSYSGIETCVALNEILNRDDIQGIVIATPAETHYTLAREALLAGKHVYVEKPLVLDEKEGQDLIQRAEDNNLVLMVGHLLQYHPIFIRLKELAHSGELGRINYIYSHRLNLGKIRREENILWSFAPHDISMILSLAGEEPDTVMATGGNYLHKKIADVTTTHMEFPSGLRSHIFVSWLHPFKVQQLVVVGERKMAVFDDTQPWSDKLLLYPHKINWQNNLPIPSKAEAERVDVPQAEPLRMECEHFLYCIGNGCRPFTDGTEGLRVLRVLNASQRSLDAGGDKVDLGVQKTKTCITGNQTEINKAFVHETAVIDSACKIGKGTKIWHFSHVLSNSSVGENCNIGQNVVIGPDVEIGNGCKIQNNVSVYKGVTLEDGVFCGPSMVFTNVINPRSTISRMDEILPTLIKTGASLGANCTIVCGNQVGRYALVGAGAVVTKNVPDHAVIVGNPGRRIGWVCACGIRLLANLTCPKCHKKYVETEVGLKEKMMLNSLSVSVVICTKNRHDDIVQCIDSLLDQTYAVNEIVVVDSSDDNGLEKILDKYISYFVIKYIYVDAILTKARNIGIDNSSSNLVMFLDDDTILDKFYVHNIVSIFNDSHGIAIGGVSGKIIQEDNPPASGLRKSLSYYRAKLLKLFSTVFFMFRYHDGIFRLSGVQTFVDYKVDKITKAEGLSG